MFDLTPEPYASFYRLNPVILDALIRWGQEAGYLGDFLTAVLENNLMEAVGRADDINREHLHTICMFVHNELPANCHGSPAKVLAWKKLHA